MVTQFVVKSKLLWHVNINTAASYIRPYKPQLEIEPQNIPSVVVMCKGVMGLLMSPNILLGLELNSEGPGTPPIGMKQNPGSVVLDWFLHSISPKEKTPPWRD